MSGLTQIKINNRKLRFVKLIFHNFKNFNIISINANKLAYYVNVWKGLYGIRYLKKGLKGSIVYFSSVRYSGKISLTVGKGYSYEQFHICITSHYSYEQLLFHFHFVQLLGYNSVITVFLVTLRSWPSCHPVFIQNLIYLFISR